MALKSVMPAQAIRGMVSGHHRDKCLWFFSTSKIPIFLPLTFYKFSVTLFGYYELAGSKFFLFLFSFFKQD